MNKKKTSIILNILLVFLEIVGLIVYLDAKRKFEFEYYTQDSNLFALITGFIYLIYLLKNKEIPKWLSILKYMSVLSLTITFLVVIFILAPMYNFDYIFMMTKGSMLYFHTLCPMIAIFSFLFYEKHKIEGIKDSIRALYFTFVYSIIIIFLNIIDLVVGPYPFLMIKKNSILASVMWTIIIEGGAFLLSILISYVKKRIGDNNE